MDENKFILRGKTFEAVEHEVKAFKCHDCDCRGTGYCHVAPECAARKRNDGRQVIFKEVKGG